MVLDGTKYDAYDFNQGRYDETVQLFSGDTISLTWRAGTTVDGIIYLHHDGVSHYYSFHYASNCNKG